MKKKKYLPLYYQWMDKGILPDYGLCRTFKKDNLMALFEPYAKDLNKLARQGKSQAFWGSGLDYNDFDRYRTFTPLRQTIVLFMACMNEEL